MKQTVTLKKDNQTRVVKKGFSFTIFFLGPIALFVRGQFLLASIYLILTLIMDKTTNSNIELLLSITLVIYSLYLSFNGNKLLKNSLIKQGYKQ